MDIYINYIIIFLIKEKESKSKVIFYVVPNGDTAKLGIDKLTDLLYNNSTIEYIKTF